MRYKKKILVLISLSAFVVLSVAAVKAPHQQKRNLKILPQNISEARLDSIMESYNVALGVKCEFCHVKSRIFQDKMDYASDAEPMKENARKMMEMTIHMNKTYFHFDKTTEPVYLTTVTCKTCHRGEPFPPED
jgi:Photosynthetic reaction centre cytochrome C subunit